MTIGLTTDAFVKTYKKDFTRIKPFAERKSELNRWCVDGGYDRKAIIIPIDDAYEPAATLPDLEVLVVTPENKARGEEISAKRKEKGLVPLALLVVPLVPAEDQKPISSTRVRNGEIDISGRLILPDNLRPELFKPLGEVLTGDAIGSSIEKNRSNIIITVGDMTTKTILTAGVIPNLIIVDFQVNRKPFPDSEAKLSGLTLYRLSVTSGPGNIAREAVDTIRKWANHPAEKMILAVTGEEDLLTLPAVAYGPVGSVVYYGQPARNATHEGLVEVQVTEEKRIEAEVLLAKFQSS